MTLDSIRNSCDVFFLTTTTYKRQNWNFFKHVIFDQFDHSKFGSRAFISGKIQRKRENFGEISHEDCVCGGAEESLFPAINVKIVMRVSLISDLRSAVAISSNPNVIKQSFIE